MLEDEAHSMTSEQEFDYFAERYSVAFVLLDKTSDKLRLGDPNQRVCRYCKKGAPETSFKKVAHTVPHMTGNKWLTSLDECDRCNEIFAVHEDHFGKYALPLRTLSGIRGKNGLPTLKTSLGRVEATETGVNVSHNAGSPILASDDERKQLTIRVARHTYVPMGVYKSLVKMALALMPAEELPKYEYFIPWILEREYRAESCPFSPLTMLEQIATSRPREAGIRILLFRRNPGILDCPSCCFVLLFGNIQYQIILPSPVEDAHFVGKEFPPLVWFPVPNTPDQRFGPSIRRVRDLSSSQPVSDDVQEAMFSYESIMPVPPLSVPGD
ncbi:MAG: hypothetical protein JWR07_1821 [Nevskia sp.]|nr:hypothetical protein [Nevskia sp.]